MRYLALLIAFFCLINFSYIQANCSKNCIVKNEVEECSSNVLPCSLKSLSINENNFNFFCGNDSCQSCQSVNGTYVNPGCFTCSSCPENPKRNKNSQNCCLTTPCIPCQRSCSLICNTPHSIFIPRSQGANTARELVAWQDYLYRLTPDCNYVVTSHTLGYSRSFRPKRIAQYLFGSDVINFAGSQVADRPPCALLADYFGLSSNFKGKLKVNPVIENIVFDNQIYFGLDGIACGLYAKIYAPLVHTRWSLRYCQINEIAPNQCTNFPACYMSENETQATCSIEQALSGNFTFGDMKEPWNFGRFSSKTLTKTGFADIDLILGWNYFHDELYHFGLYGLLVLPTGNKPNSRFIFEPIIGNGKHLELGLGLSTHVLLWQCGSDQSLTFYLEGNVTHMFKNTQLRSFDFCSNGPLSRYLLLKEFVKQGDTLVYSGNLINAINFTTRAANVTVSVKGDASAKLAFRCGCWQTDIGYNFYANTREKISLKDKYDSRFFGIKGTEDVCALEYTVTQTNPRQFADLVNKIQINSTQSNATICQKGSTDNSENIILNSNNNIAITSHSAQSGPIESQNVIIAHNSSKPVLVSIKDLDLESGAAGATATHKVFGQVTYEFNDPYNCARFIPFVGFGGEFEVEGLACNERTSLNQWSLWIKGGISY